MSPDKMDRQSNEALLRTRIICQSDNIQYLAQGMEGTLSTDGTWVYKYFHKGKENFNPGQLDFIKTKVLKKRFKHITYLENIIETDDEVIFQIELNDGKEYSGGYLDQIRELLIELKEKRVGYRNICPKNMIISNGQLFLCDLGHSFVELDEHEFLVMMKRAYLSYKFHFRDDLTELMRKAIDKDIPELFEFRYFQRTVETKLTTIPKDGEVILNPFSTFSMETENFKRSLPPEASFQKEFNHRLLEKETGEEKTVTHLPFEMLERSYMKEGLSISHIKELSSTDFQLLSPGSDFIHLQTEMIRKPRYHDVSLLIKASPIEWETIDFQIKHIIKQLNTPQQFSEVVVVTDTHNGPFLRQYAEPNYEILMEKLNKLLEDGWIDRIEVAPYDEKTILQTYDKWFSLRSLSTHASNGQHLYTSLHGIDQCKGKYILQLDSDCIIVRKDFNRDYLTEMIILLEDNPKAISIPFAVGSENEGTEESTGLGSWRTEVRFSLIDKERLTQLLPLPNELDKDGKLIRPWHRALDEKVQELKIRTFRRSNPNTFFIHVQNGTKRDVNLWYNILKNAEKGRNPQEQYGNVDLISNIGLWLGTRAEKFVFLIRGQNVELSKLRRMFETVEEQANQDWGCVFIDAGSKNGMEEYINNVILPKHPDKITFYRNWRSLTPLENTCIGISHLISNPESVVITLDADDALIGDKVLDILESNYRKGADLTVGTMLRTDKDKEYPVDFKTPREKNGGNVWQHLRTFKKSLFDAIPEEYFKINGEWIPHSEDWAFMLPMVDIAEKPTHILDVLYFYEPSPQKNDRSIAEREMIIGSVINKLPLVRNEKSYPITIESDDKYEAAKEFRSKIIEEYIKWFNGDIEELYGEKPPSKEMKVNVGNSRENAILTWGKLHQEQKYLKVLGLSPDIFAGKRILDLGSGPYPSAMVFKDCEIYCLEPLVDFFKRIGYPFNYYDLRVRFVSGYAEKMPFQDNFFDAIISVNSIDHVDCFHSTSQEIKRVLKSDGILRLHVHYHKPTKLEPLELNDSVMYKEFAWCDGFRTISVFNKTGISNCEKHTLWSNFYKEGQSEKNEKISAGTNKPKLFSSIVIPTSPGPRYTTSLDLLEMDITYACNLKCNNCNRSCAQAPSNEQMTVAQIQKFIKQSIESGRRFKRIRILGGEPLIHPDIIEIINSIVNYCESESTDTIIEVSTNGYGEKVKETINSIPSWINVINSYKTSPEIENFEPFNLAPCDLTDFIQKDYENACWITHECGIGLNKYGFYHCAVAAGIDRVIGLDIGLKELPRNENGFIEQKRKLCGYCGHFLNRERIHTQDRSKIFSPQITESWKIAYDRYEQCKPLLSEY
jgi:uncharacterized radical SAM superfamily Fe-S cluster-containing enzyme